MAGTCPIWRRTWFRRWAMRSRPWGRRPSRPSPAGSTTAAAWRRSWRATCCWRRWPPPAAPMWRPKCAAGWRPCCPSARSCRRSSRPSYRPSSLTSRTAIRKWGPSHRSWWCRSWCTLVPTTCSGLCRRHVSFFSWRIYPFSCWKVPNTFLFYHAFMWHIPTYIIIITIILIILIISIIFWELNQRQQSHASICWFRQNDRITD